MKKTTALLAAGIGGSMLFGVPSAEAAFTGVEAAATNRSVDGVMHTVWRLYAAFDNPLDQLNIVSGNAGNPVVITTSSGVFLNVANPTGGNPDLAPSAFAVSFAPDLAHDSFITLDNTNSFLSDGLTVLNLDGAGSTAGDWGTGPALQGNQFVLTNAAWRKNPANADVFATLGRVAFGQFTVESGARLDGVLRLAVVQDGVSSNLIGVTFNFASNPIPAPAVSALLSLAALGAGRRRRRA